MCRWPTVKTSGAAWVPFRQEVRSAMTQTAEITAANGYANPAALVSIEWVAQHMGDPTVRLLEVDVNTTAYEKGHIAGAVGIDWTKQLSDRVRRDILDKAAWEE